MKNLIILSLLLYLFTFPMEGKTQSLKVVQTAINTVNKTTNCNCNNTNNNLLQYHNLLPSSNREVLLIHSNTVFNNYGVFERQLTPIRNKPLTIIKYNAEFSRTILKPL